MRKRILIISPFPFYPPVSGGENVVFNNIDSLSKYYDLTLLFPEPTRDHYLEGVKKLKERFSVVTVPVKEVPFEELTLLGKFNSTFRRLCSKYVILGIDEFYKHPNVKSLIADNNFDLINIEHSWNYHDELRKRKCPMVLVQHNFEFEYWKQMGLSFWKQKRYLNGLIYIAASYKIRHQDRAALKDSEQIIALSHRDRRLMARTADCGHKVFVRPAGIKLGPYNDFLGMWRIRRLEERKSDILKLIYAGALDSFQTAEAAIYFIKDVYPLLVNAGINFELYIVGRGQVDELEKAAKNDKRIILTGFVKDVKEYIAQADLYLVPVRYGAGIKIKVMEAMAMGKPIVATSKALDGLDVVCTGIVIADTAAAFADAILNLARNAQLRKNMGIACRDYAVANFDWDKNFEKHDIGIYQRMMHEGGGQDEHR